MKNQRMNNSRIQTLTVTPRRLLQCARRWPHIRLLLPARLWPRLGHRVGPGGAAGDGGARAAGSLNFVCIHVLCDDPRKYKMRRDGLVVFLGR